MARQRYLVTVEVFADADWVEGERSYPGQADVDVVWGALDQLQPDGEGFSANVVKVEKRRKR